jgi:hypothetical protein
LRLFPLLLWLTACAADPPALTPGPPPLAPPPAPPPPPPPPPGPVRFDNGLAPFTTVHPSDTIASASACRDTGCEFTFVLKRPAGAATSRAVFHLPKPAATAEALAEAQLDGPDSLFRRHPTWTRGQPTAADPSLPWLVRGVRFEDGASRGRVLIGTSPAGAFYVVEEIAADDHDRASAAFADLYAHIEMRPISDPTRARAADPR